MQQKRPLPAILATFALATGAAMLFGAVDRFEGLAQNGFQRWHALDVALAALERERRRTTL
jgi:hypothetical protein